MPGTHGCVTLKFVDRCAHGELVQNPVKGFTARIFEHDGGLSEMLRYCVIAWGRTVHSESSSSLREYSYSNFFCVCSEGLLDEGASIRTDAEPGRPECSPR
jgi:hypothetical protein